MYCIASRRVLSPLKEEERQSLLTQAHLLEAEGKPVQARDMLAVARRLVCCTGRVSCCSMSPRSASIRSCASSSGIASSEWRVTEPPSWSRVT